MKHLLLCIGGLIAATSSLAACRSDGVHAVSEERGEPMVDIEAHLTGLDGELMRPAPLLSHAAEVSFDDVIGATTAKKTLVAIATMLREGVHAPGLASRLPRGVLLIGEPGVGKSSLAQATAHAAQYPLMTVQADALVQDILSAVSSKPTIRSVFDEARRQAPVVLVIENLESLAGHSDSFRRLSEEMDQLSGRGEVLVIGTTQAADMLEPSLLQPGRFDPALLVDLPSRAERRQLLTRLTELTPHQQDVDLDLVNDELAYTTPADIKLVVHAAASRALLAGRQAVSADDYEQTFDALALGPENNSYPTDEAMRWRTALHEAGHAVMSTLFDCGQRVRKVSLTPRMGSEGVTMFTPNEPFVPMTQERLINMLATAQAGFLAETHFMPDGPGAGSSYDLLKAQTLARQAVLVWGFAEQGQGGRLGRGLGLKDAAMIGNHLKERMDEDVGELLLRASELARSVFAGPQSRAFLAVAEALYDQGELRGEQVRQLCAPFLHPASDADKSMRSLDELRRYAGAQTSRELDSAPGLRVPEAPRALPYSNFDEAFSSSDACPASDLSELQLSDFALPTDDSDSDVSSMAEPMVPSRWGYESGDSALCDSRQFIFPSP